MEIVAEQAGARVRLRFPYQADAVQFVRRLPGREWDADSKTWFIPPGAVRELRQWAARSGNILRMSDTLAASLDESSKRRQRLLNLRRETDSPAFEISSSTIPYPFQRAGITYLLEALTGSSGGVLLADDMGLGKSFQALAAAVHTGAFPALILCPAILKANWALEIEKHFPDLSCVIVEGEKTKRDILWGDSTAKVVIANYELLLRDVAPLARKWKLVICDEAQRIKNAQAVTTRRVKKLSRAHSLALTGTPIENRLEDLASIMEFVQPGLLGDYWEFRRQHCVLNSWGSVIGYQGVDSVKERIAPYYLRRTKRQVLTQLPPKVYVDLEVLLSKDEHQAYIAIRDQILEFVKANPLLRASNILALLTRLRQCVDSLALVGLGTASSKLIAFQEILEGAGEQQIVVFSSFRHMAELVAETAGGMALHGEIPSRRQEEILAAFHKREFQVLACTDVLAYGRNLVSASIVVHVEPHWNPARMRQREDRLHRIGQENPVTVVNLLAKNTVDGYVRRVIQRKLSLLSDILGDDEQAAMHLTRSELVAFLEGGLDA